MSVIVEMGETEYRLIGPGGEEGQCTEYGLPAIVQSGADFYYAHVTDPDTQSPQVFRVASVDPTDSSVDDVDFMADGDDPDDTDTGPDEGVIPLEPGEPEQDEPDGDDPDEEEEEEDPEE